MIFSVARHCLRETPPLLPPTPHGEAGTVFAFANAENLFLPDSNPVPVLGITSRPMMGRTNGSSSEVPTQCWIRPGPSLSVRHLHPVQVGNHQCLQLIPPIPDLRLERRCLRCLSTLENTANGVDLGTVDSFFLGEKVMMRIRPKVEQKLEPQAHTKPAYLASPITSAVEGVGPSCPTAVRNSIKDNANARAPLHGNIELHLSSQTNLALVRRGGGSWQKH